MHLSHQTATQLFSWGFTFLEQREHALANSGSSASVLNKQFRVSWIIQLCLSTLFVFSSSFEDKDNKAHGGNTIYPLFTSGGNTTYPWFTSGFLADGGLETNVTSLRKCIDILIFQLLKYKMHIYFGLATPLLDIYYVHTLRMFVRTQARTPLTALRVPGRSQGASLQRTSGSSGMYTHLWFHGRHSRKDWVYLYVSIQKNIIRNVVLKSM